MTDTAARESDGLYLHPETTPTMRQTAPDGTELVWVPAHEFMQVQKERDDWRRLACLLHAQHYYPDLFTPTEIEHQAAKLALTRLDASAMAGLVEQARTW